jgi:hypothetical protein
MPDGQFLPLEFARQSKNGRFTLVLLAEGERVPVHHGILKVPDNSGHIWTLPMIQGNHGLSVIEILRFVSMNSICRLERFST